MKTNMGKADRIIRFLIALTIVILYTSNVISGTFGIILLVIATVLVFTSVVGFCPLYKILGMNTCPSGQKSSD